MREKEPSNLTAPSPRRFTLPKKNILRGRKNFTSLFSHSKTLHSDTLSLRYKILNDDHSDFKIAFIAPKKIGTAVKRNRTKRLMREAFRLNQFLLSSNNSNDDSLHLALIAKKSNSDFKSVETEVVTLLTNLRNRVADHTHLNT